MFAARGAGVSLAIFVLIYIISSLMMAGSWRLAFRLLRLSSPRRDSNLLFVLRILPFALASLVMLGIALPSFLLLEPRATDESVGTAPAALAIGALALVIFGIVRAVRAQRRTSRALEMWLNGSTRIESGASVPVFRSRQPSPGLTVAGVRDPKVIVSETAVAALTPPELHTALRHEIAHVRRYDNLKKLIFRLVVFPGYTELEGTWATQTELAADDDAVSNIGDALDLASALIKVSRLAACPSPELSTGLLHSSTALTVRIQRLCSWSETPENDDRWIWLWSIPAAVTASCLVLGYGSLLGGMHQITEWLVR